MYGRTFQLVDTGGLLGETLEHTDRFAPMIKAQASVAMDEADAIVFMLDYKTGVSTVDKEIARMLRTRKANGQTVVVAVNKADNITGRDENAEVAVSRLGLGEVHSVSAIHGEGVLPLFETVLKQLPEDRTGFGEPEAATIRVSIVGQPNAGKSSLLNRIIEQERSIVSDVPGTTHDPVDCSIVWRDLHELTLIDTAGIRRRSTHKVGLEKSSVLWAMKAIERSHVVLMVIDATVGLTEQDLKIAGFITDNNKSVILVINKWDLYTQNKRNAAKQLENTYFNDHQEHRSRSKVSLLDEILNDDLVVEDSRPPMGGGKKKRSKRPKEEIVEEEEEELMDDEGGEVILSKKDYLLQKNSSEIGYTMNFWPERNANVHIENGNKLVDDLEDELNTLDIPEDFDDQDYIGEDQKDGKEEEEDDDEEDEDEKEKRFIKSYWRYMEKLEEMENVQVKRAPPPDVQLPAQSKEQKEFEKSLREKLTFLDYAPILFTSAKTGFCVPTALDLSIKATFKHKLPKKGKKALKIKFASQSKGHPPSFVFFVNDPDRVQPSFVSYMLRSIRESYPFMGTPINLYFRKNKKRGDLIK
eukprot:gene6708-7801_t